MAAIETDGSPVGKSPISGEGHCHGDGEPRTGHRGGRDDQFDRGDDEHARDGELDAPDHRFADDAVDVFEPVSPADDEQHTSSEQPRGGEFTVRDSADDRQPSDRFHGFDGQRNAVEDSPDDLKDGEPDEQMRERGRRQHPQRDDEREHRNRISYRAGQLSGADLERPKR
jgi:hypothetical protein